MLRYVTGVLAQHRNPVLVETGTYQGDGVETALALGFPKVISIEIFYDFFDACKKKFAADSRVTILHGNSALMLWDAIKDVDDRITFWLDGHAFPEEDKPLGGKACPLLEELEQISRHRIKSHAIMIDDISSLVKGGCYKGSCFTRNDIESTISAINRDYSISYFDRGGTDVLIASVKT